MPTISRTASVRVALVLGMLALFSGGCGAGFGCSSNAGGSSQAGLPPEPTSDLAVIPGAVGFGMNTPAGRGGKIYKVINLKPSGFGSLEACIDRTGPRVCVFEVSGTIRLSENLSVSNPFITIAGQTAPSPGITLRGAALEIETSDVLVQHLRIRVGDAASGPNPDNRDGLQIENDETGLTRVVVDHCSISWAVDENVALWSGWDNVTLRNNIISEGLDDSIHPKGNHSMGVITGPVDGHLSMIGNLLAHHGDRHPLSNAGKLVYVNNIVYNAAEGLKLQNQGGFATMNSLVGNVFIRGNSYSHNNDIYLYGGSVGLDRGTQIYVHDNIGSELGSDPWDLVQNESALSRESLQASSPPVWPAGLSARPASATVDWVLTNAGARPADRDLVDQRIVDDVRNGAGVIIDSPADVGGWQELEQNTRALTLPANPNADDDGDGYTNLEEWLHAFAAEVEGR